MTYSYVEITSFSSTTEGSEYQVCHENGTRGVKCSKRSYNQGKTVRCSTFILGKSAIFAICLSFGQSAAQPYGLQSYIQLNVECSLSVQLFLFPTSLLGGAAGNVQMIWWHGACPTATAAAAVEQAKQLASLSLSLWSFLWLFGHKLCLRDNFTLFLKLNGRVMRRKMLPE